MLLWVRRSPGKAGFLRRTPKSGCPMKFYTPVARAARPAPPSSELSWLNPIRQDRKERKNYRLSIDSGIGFQADIRCSEASRWMAR